jgi:hypothetical protein
MLGTSVPSSSLNANAEDHNTIVIEADAKT